MAVKTKLPSGRPSICEWNLCATFKIKEQAVAVVNALLQEEVDFPVTYRTDLTETATIYIVEIDGMHWANNLKTAARIMKKFDHKL